MHPTIIEHGFGLSRVANLVYVVFDSVWIAAVALVVRRQRRLGEPLLNRTVRLATERAT